MKNAIKRVTRTVDQARVTMHRSKRTTWLTTEGKKGTSETTDHDTVSAAKAALAKFNE